VVECYDLALQAIERGEYSREYAESLKVTLSKVFNRGFWGGYYAGAKVVEHSTNYGSSATRRKVYVGKVTNYFKRLGVAEVLIEASPLAVGDEILWMGETTGCVEQIVGEIRLDLNPVDAVKQGDVCSIKVEGAEIRRGDKLYKEEIR
jgi:putative protease